MFVVWCGMVSVGRWGWMGEALMGGVLLVYSVMSVGVW